MLHCVEHSPKWFAYMRSEKPVCEIVHNYLLRKVMSYYYTIAEIYLAGESRTKWDHHQT